MSPTSATALRDKPYRVVRVSFRSSPPSRPAMRSPCRARAPPHHPPPRRPLATACSARCSACWSASAWHSWWTGLTVASRISPSSKVSTACRSLERSTRARSTDRYGRPTPVPRGRSVCAAQGAAALLRRRSGDTLPSRDFSGPRRRQDHGGSEPGDRRSSRGNPRRARRGRSPAPQPVQPARARPARTLRAPQPQRRFGGHDTRNRVRRSIQRCGAAGPADDPRRPVPSQPGQLLESRAMRRIDSHAGRTFRPGDLGQRARFRGLGCHTAHAPSQRRNHRQPRGRNDSRCCQTCADSSNLHAPTLGVVANGLTAGGAGYYGYGYGYSPSRSGDNFAGEDPDVPDADVPASGARPR